MIGTTLVSCRGQHSFHVGDNTRLVFVTTLAGCLGQHSLGVGDKNGA